MVHVDLIQYENYFDSMDGSPKESIFDWRRWAGISRNTKPRSKKDEAKSRARTYGTTSPTKYTNYRILHPAATSVIHILLYTHPQNASASPPYRLGNSRASMMGKRAFCIAWWLVPTTAIFANVLAEMSGLKTQKIQLSSVGTLTKNFLCYNWNI